MIQKISTAAGFIEIYEANLPSSPSYTEAYERTEQLHESIMGWRRYSSYNSFRHTRDKAR